MTQTKEIGNNCVVTDRGGIVENIHRVHVAVTDSQGNVLFAIGNPSRVTLARSAAKPAQAIAVIETGAFDNAGFGEADLALMCASHSCEDRHIDRARKMLAKAGVHEEQYRCGGHASLSDFVNKRWIRAGIEPLGGIYNNCSGKHAAMMAGALALGSSVEDYHLPDHPMQTLVKQVVEDLCPNPTLIQWGIDGCNLPAPAFPLSYLGRIYALFAAAADQAEQKEESGSRTKNLSRVFHAMTNHPECVGGDGRFCTELMEVYQGQLIGKLGADGCYGVGIRESEQTRSLGARDALGIAVKVDDGSIEILYAVVVEVLEQLDIGTPEIRQSLGKWHHLERRNTMGVKTGSVYLDIKLQAVS
ncbi:hypothetical protein MRS44_015090 [Fusarium solani]|jgi:L-asparaginase II|uniref:L-asparaginase II n=1 Tax=Fusarium solani TaxID=169388 RepID=A0A9P9GI44_FUSSL|nr:L-asparaginase II [Fusarium solani]KAH7239581.1 L-asparaginase II [Fusarium solani]KAJ3459017.1 hypothetical protein MRS44_015090 [Fusarium solani]